MIRAGQVITLELSSLDELLTTRSTRTFPAKGIDADAERFLYGQTDRMKWTDVPHIRVVLPADEIEPDTEDLIATVAQRYFSYRASEAQFELALTFGRGLTSLIVAAVFVGILLVVDYVVDQVHNDFLGTAYAALFVIAAWVAVWVPIEIFLFDWWPIGRRAKVYQDLSKMTVEVVEATAG